MKFNIQRSIRAFFSGAARIHFSQYGEDVFLHKKFRNSDINRFYVDIGAHHPFHLSNTAYLWAKKWNGINIDASQHVIDQFNKHRALDTNIATAVVDEEFAAQQSTITFYYSKGIDNCATCDPKLASERGLNQKETVPCTSLKNIIQQACEKFQGNFGLLNIDIEGLDEKVISNIQSWPQKPEVIMIEIYGESILDIIRTEAYKILTEAGYIFTQRIGHTTIFEATH